MKVRSCTETICCIGRLYIMYKQAMGFMRGMGTGLLAGVTLVAVSGKMMRGNRGMRRRANRTMRTFGELMDNVQGMFR